LPETKQSEDQEYRQIFKQKDLKEQLSSEDQGYKQKSQQKMRYEELLSKLNWMLKESKEVYYAQESRHRLQLRIL
jgi:hypothetical protein